MINDSAGQVRRIFIADDFRADLVLGASDDEIDRMAGRQDVGSVPEALREVLRLLGRKAGPWFPGTTFGVDAVDEQVKRDALDCLDETDEHGMRDPENMFVVLDGGGSSYLVVDGSDVDDPDPPLWMLTETGHVVQRWDSVTSWFENVANGVRERKKRAASRRARGKSAPADKLRISADKIEPDVDGCLLYEGKPFTGEVVERGAGESLLALISYLNGFQHGPYREWYPTGQRSEGEVRYGHAVGIHKRWHPNGRLARETEFDEAGKLVCLREWDENGTLTEDGP